MYKNEDQEIEIRNTIINAAREVFSRYGFKKTTMQDIASASGKAKSSLYHYFRSKEDVFASVLEKEVAILKDEVMAAIEKEDSAQDKLISYFISRMRAFKKLINFYSAFRDEYLENFSFIQRLRKSYDNYEVQMIQSLLKQGVDKGDFIISDLPMTASAILTALKGMEFQWAIEEDVDSIEQNIRSVVKVLFYGIVRRQ
jgi:AcrR family transcriptional regulator